MHSMRHNVWQLDREVIELRDRRRDALNALRAGGEPAPPPFNSRLFRIHDELRESDDRVAQAVAKWLDVLVVERAGWEDRVRLEGLWNTTHRVAGLDDPTSMRTMRNDMLSGSRAAARAVFSQGLLSIGRPASDLAVTALVARLEQEQGSYLAVDGEELAVDAAERVLSATADVAAEAAPGLVSQACAAVGAKADVGWPARLTQRWVAEVFAGTGLGDGLDLRFGALPRPWGALSFARAFGALGAAVLDAARPGATPFSLHKRARGCRRHARRALFAAIVLERPFAKRVLGLGVDSVRNHQRHVARALCLTIRFDALRVLVTAALRDGEGAGRERFGEITAHHFGEAAQVGWLGVLPRLRPADGAALVGAVLAFGHRAALVDVYDEDWFRNPHAMESIRHQDELVAGPAPTEDELLLAVDALKDVLEAAAG